MNETIVELLSRLSLLRIEVSEVSESVEEKADAYMQTDAYKAYQDELSKSVELGSRIVDLEKEIRQRSLDEFNLLLNKHPFTGIEIKMRKKVAYEDKSALEFCRKQNVALKIDKTAFERYAKAVAEAGQPIDFVSITEEPQVQISSDLSDYLPK
jgi:hypothetical protein